MVETERDLVLAEAFGRPLYQPRKVRADENGQIFVLDGGNHRVIVFDAHGAPLLEMGKEGQGPGEFQSVRAFGLLGDSVVVYDSRNVRWSVYRNDGTHVEDRTLDDRIYPGEMRDVGGRLLIVNADPAFILPDSEELPPMFWRAGFYAIEGLRFEAVVEFEYTFDLHWEKDRSAGSVPLSAPFPLGALADAVVYVTDGVGCHAMPTSRQPTSMRTTHAAWSRSPLRASAGALPNATASARPGSAPSSPKDRSCRLSRRGS